jgi:hypothetical protein
VTVGALCPLSSSWSPVVSVPALKLASGGWVWLGVPSAIWKHFPIIMLCVKEMWEMKPCLLLSVHHGVCAAPKSTPGQAVTPAFPGTLRLRTLGWRRSPRLHIISIVRRGRHKVQEPRAKAFAMRKIRNGSRYNTQIPRSERGRKG